MPHACRPSISSVCNVTRWSPHAVKLAEVMHTDDCKYSADPVKANQCLEYL
jgi:hypothetical protein